MSATLVFQGEERPPAVWMDRAARAATGLVAEGYGHRAKIGILLPNGFDFVEAYRAIGLAGGTPIPISTDMSPLDYRLLGKRERLDALITDHQRNGLWPAESVRRTWVVGADAPSTRSWECLLANAQGCAPQGHAHGQMFFTSGTTAVPKTVLRASLPDEILALRMRRFRASWGMDPGMRALVTGPIYYQASLFYILGAVECAERVVLLEAFNPQSVLQAIAHHRVMHIQLVPRLMIRLSTLGASERAAYDLSTLKFALHGAARCEASIGCFGCSPGVVLRDWESPNPLSNQSRSPDEHPYACPIYVSEATRDGRGHHQARLVGGRGSCRAWRQRSHGEEVAWPLPGQRR